MADLNQVQLIGRLTRDPELKELPTGAIVGAFGLATNRKYKNQNGTEVTEVTFIEVKIFGKLAEVAGKYLKKGSQVFLGGWLKFESWDEKETGKKRSRLVVRAENIQFLDSKAEKNGHAEQEVPAPVAASDAPADEPAVNEPPF